MADVPAWLFHAFAVLALLGAAALLLCRGNLVVGVLGLASCSLALGGISVLLEAYLVGAFQVLVGAGAIGAVLLFATLVLELRAGGPPAGWRPLRLVAGVAIAAALLGPLLLRLPGALPPAAEAPPGFGGYREVGRLLFTDYVLAFELVSLLLLTALVAGVALSRRED